MAAAVKRKKETGTGKKQTRETGRLTVPDLVILSLLAERPMHGYEVNATLDGRKIREWAPVSRPQIYYSLDKLVALELIRTTSDDEPATGPERTVFETTADGRDRLAEALDEHHWISDKIYQPFLIWLALSWQTRGRTFQRQLENRKKLVASRLAVERSTLKDVLAEVGHRHHEAVWMLELKIEQSEIELRWVEKILKNAARRAPAKRGAGTKTSRKAVEKEKLE